MKKKEKMIMNDNHVDKQRRRRRKNEASEAVRKMEIVFILALDWIGSPG